MSASIKPTASDVLEAYRELRENLFHAAELAEGIKEALWNAGVNADLDQEFAEVEIAIDEMDITSKGAEHRAKLAKIFKGRS